MSLYGRLSQECRNILWLGIDRWSDASDGEAEKGKLVDNGPSEQTSSRLLVVCGCLAKRKDGGHSTSEFVGCRSEGSDGGGIWAAEGEVICAKVTDDE